MTTTGYAGTEEDATALRAAGIPSLYAGTWAAFRRYLKQGDTAVVTQASRISRSPERAQAIIAELARDRITVVVLGNGGSMRRLLPNGDLLGTAGPCNATVLTITVRRSTVAGDTLAVAARGPVAGVRDSQNNPWARTSRNGRRWEAPNTAPLAAFAGTVSVVFAVAAPGNEAIAVRLSAGKD